MAVPVLEGNTPLPSHAFRGQQKPFVGDVTTTVFSDFVPAAGSVTVLVFVENGEIGCAVTDDGSAGVCRSDIVCVGALLGCGFAVIVVDGAT